MINLQSTTPTISLNDLMETLRNFVDNGGYSSDELIYFCSELTGASEDAIVETLDKIS